MKEAKDTKNARNEQEETLQNAQPEENTRFLYLSPGQQPVQRKRERTGSHVEPPRPPGWNLLVLTRSAIKIPDDAWKRGNDMLVEGLAERGEISGQEAEEARRRRPNNRREKRRRKLIAECRRQKERDCKQEAEKRAGRTKNHARRHGENS
jgi:hypothetical protein